MVWSYRSLTLLLSWVDVLGVTQLLTHYVEMGVSALLCNVVAVSKNAE